MRSVGTHRGFTLVEILIVVVIMGILAAVVVQELSHSSDRSRLVGATGQLRILREAIDLYRNQHQNRLPGQADAFPDTVFAEQLTMPTDEQGQRSTAPDKGFGDPNFPYGPYLNHGHVPRNPFNGSNLVMTVSTMPANPPGGGRRTDPGWVYEITSGRIKINYDGTTPDGLRYWDL